MALTVKQLNSDASFLLSFEPLLPETAQETVTPRPFTILLDPWLTGSSEIFHKKISVSTQKEAPCIASLLDLPEPDLVIISQHKSDHCNEATLRQLPARNTKTLILAEPASAKVIRSWRHFSNGKVKTIPRWQDPRLTGKEAVLRIPVPAVGSGGHRGEVTVAFIPQKRDLAGLHSAIGITYRPPSTHNLVGHRRPSYHVVTPPSRSPSPFRSTFNDFKEKLLTTNPYLLPPSPPQSAHSLRSCRSASTIAQSPTWPEARSESPHSTARPVSSLYSSHLLNVGTTSRINKSATSIPSTTSHCHPVSVIFAPHGILYSALEPYATSHLVAEAALPLTALMHCMNSVDNPWWMGGNINSGAPAGAVTAAKLGARIWVGAHDGDKDVRGLATGMLKTRRYRRHEMRRVVAQANSANATMAGRAQPQHESQVSIVEDSSSTEILQLSTGEEVLVSGDGAMLWCPSTAEHDEAHPTDLEAQVGANSDINHIRDDGHDEQGKGRNQMSMPKTATKASLRARASMSFIANKLKMS